MKSAGIQDRAMEQLASGFAEEIGFNRRSASVYVRSSERSIEWFFVQSEVRWGEGEFTPCVGIEIPSVNALVSLTSGPEQGEFPTLGGPLFRFVDLTQRRLHEFIIKVSAHDDLPRALRELRALWNEIGEPFLVQRKSAAGWLDEVDCFLEQNRLGSLDLATIARVCMSIRYAARGSDAARAALQILSTRGSNCRPVQDYAEAQRLFLLIENDPMLLRELKNAFDC